MNKLKLNISSTFTLTFAVEVIGLDVWHDCKEGWVNLALPEQGFKLSYHLYPGQTFEVDVVIWPHVAKVACQANYVWVRTWNFLERRWLSFSIRHSFPVKVSELREYVATIIPHSGLGVIDHNNKSMYSSEIYLPPLKFGDQRQFADVVEGTPPLKQYMRNLIWSVLEHIIPCSVNDDPINIPQRVKDIRHQDAVLSQIRDVILRRGLASKKQNVVYSRSVVQTAQCTENRPEIKLRGDWILAGIGKVIPFETTTECTRETGEVIALISSSNLPAQDDLPIFCVNVCNISDVPIKHLKQNRFTHIYTSWTIGKEKQNSEKLSLENFRFKTEVNFNYHHSVPLSSAVASDVKASFLDKPFHIELRGIRTPAPLFKTMTLFGYGKGDENCCKSVPLIPNQDVDVPIAHTRIDARALTKTNGFIKGEFPLYPPETSVGSLNREGHCTNDINSIRAKVKPNLFVQPSVILEAQMMIEVSMGLFGSNPKSNAERYSRLHCLISNSEAIMALLRQISEINESAMQIENRSGLLTGFALDTGDTVLLFVEGPKDGQILQLWQRTEDFYPIVKSIFSTSAMYNSRLYHDFVSKTPFNVMKMYVPINVLLSLTAVYVRPALPLPARSALLKIGRLIASKLKSAPSCFEMPTALELMSFRLELCVPPRIVHISEKPSVGAWAEREPSEKNAKRIMNAKLGKQK